MKDYALKSYKIDLSNKRFFQKPACVDLSLFDLKLKKAPELLKELGLENKIVCVYAGKFGGSYLENEVFDFFKSCHNFWGENFMVLLLSSHTETEIFNYAEKAKLPQNIFVKRFVAHADVPRYMALADFAITPFKPVPSKRYGSPVKDGEYWAMGLPVVITKDISDDSDIIEKYNIGAVLPELSEEAYQNAIQKIDFLLQTAEKENLCAKIRAIAEKYRSFEIAEKIYRQIYGEIAQKEA
jgi:glycosyltransferase involved in cell wall biosynthesis